MSRCQSCLRGALEPVHLPLKVVYGHLVRREDAFESLRPEREGRGILNCLAFNFHSFLSQPRFAFCSANSELGKLAAWVPVGKKSTAHLGRAGAEGPHFTGEQKGGLSILQSAFSNPSYDPPSILKQRT